MGGLAALPPALGVLVVQSGIRGAESGVSELTQAQFETFWYFLCPCLCCPSSSHSRSWSLLGVSWTSSARRDGVMCCTFSGMSVSFEAELL